MEVLLSAPESNCLSYGSSMCQKNTPSVSCMKKPHKEFQEHIIDVHKAFYEADEHGSNFCNDYSYEGSSNLQQETNTGYKSHYEVPKVEPPLPSEDLSIDANEIPGSIQAENEQAYWSELCSSPNPKTPAMLKLPKSPSLSSDVERFEPFTPCDEFLFTRNEHDYEDRPFVDVPERPWCRALRGMRMNSWQQGRIAFAIAEANQHVNMGKSNCKTGPLNEAGVRLNARSAIPDLYSKDGYSLTGREGLGYHSDYGVCKKRRLMPEHLKVKLSEIPLTLSPDINPELKAVTKPTRSKKRCPGQKDHLLGESIRIKAPKYTEVGNGDGFVFLNFRVRPQNRSKNQAMTLAKKIKAGV